MKFQKQIAIALPVAAILLLPTLGYCDVEGSLRAIQYKLINGILPIMGILGIVFAAFSFFTGNPGARNHLILAMVGAVIGFAAPSIILLIQSLVH